MRRFDIVGVNNVRTNIRVSALPRSSVSLVLGFRVRIIMAFANLSPGLFDNV